MCNLQIHKVLLTRPKQDYKDANFVPKHPKPSTQDNSSMTVPPLPPFILIMKAKKPCSIKKFNNSLK